MWKKENGKRDVQDREKENPLNLFFCVCDEVLKGSDTMCVSNLLVTRSFCRQGTKSDESSLKMNVIKCSDKDERARKIVENSKHFFFYFQHCCMVELCQVTLDSMCFHFFSWHQILYHKILSQNASRHGELRTHFSRAIAWKLKSFLFSFFFLFRIINQHA
jgi:hypothetical protein